MDLEGEINKRKESFKLVRKLFDPKTTLREGALIAEIVDDPAKVKECLELFENEHNSCNGKNIEQTIREAANSITDGWRYTDGNILFYNSLESKRGSCYELSAYLASLLEHKGVDAKLAINLDFKYQDDHMIVNVDDKYVDLVSSIRNKGLFVEKERDTLVLDKKEAFGYKLSLSPFLFEDPLRTIALCKISTELFDNAISWTNLSGSYVELHKSGYAKHSIELQNQILDKVRIYSEKALKLEPRIRKARHNLDYSKRHFVNLQEELV